ncbi:DUF559 domain-containing protein [Pseudonocardia sp. KRD291]|uniref:DUF559 domain-containing protein n=1 Tax=Pseudonocardia sp. KRD291 TaxID=2792007 RepID=UPI001C4A0B11|nr:DUF559 domain-containing protein [Pseudonocardia sp. KRD291]MBW0102815.1 DUF559 domain-containing protein [Pseudonocardia sp. KRD291]
MDLSRPFVGSEAVAAGVVTRARLRGRGFRALFHGIYVRADVPVTLALRSEAAYLLVDGVGALAGYSAAEVLGASCGPLGVPAEVIVPGGNRRAQSGLIVHRGALAEDEPVFRAGMLVTSPARTACDLARRLPRIDAVAAIDALAFHGEFDPARVLEIAARHPGARGSRRLGALVALADRRSQSPMETRLRLALHDGGLPPPTLQHPVGPYFLDLCYPDLLLAIEYNGGHHRTAEQALYDLDREAYVVRNGWHVVRLPARDVLGRPDVVADRVRYERAIRADRASRHGG